jgi:hypothetical protein
MIRLDLAEKISKYKVVKIFCDNYSQIIQALDIIEKEKIETYFWKSVDHLRIKADEEFKQDNKKSLILISDKRLSLTENLKKLNFLPDEIVCAIYFNQLLRSETIKNIL